MSLFQPQQHCPTMAKEAIASYFSLSREEKRTFSWQSKNIALYPMLLPILFNDVNLEQIVIPHVELNDKFNKFFSSSFKLKSISWLNDDIYNLNQLFMFTLESEIHVCEVAKKNANIEEKIRKFSTIFLNKSIGPWKKVQFYSPMVKLWSKNQSEQGKVIFTDKNSMVRFKLEILKEDFEIKQKFINQFLFCGSSPSFSIGCIQVQKFKKGQNIKEVDQKAFLIFEGSVIQEINSKTAIKHKVLGQRWKLQLERGSLICKSHLKSLLTSQRSCEYTNSYQALTNSVFLAISYVDLTKVLKIEKQTKKLLIQKLNEAESAHSELIRKSLQAEQKIRQHETKPIEYNYPIKRNKKSKAFRKKSDNYEDNFEEFITFDRFEKMTQNKQNVEKKHLIYSQLNNLLRQKEKEDRFVKKMKTQKGMKEIKKCEYQARLKQSKIENLAIKDSIFNTEKYRDRPNEIKFIFEEEIMDKFIKGEAENRINVRRHKKKFISMVAFDEQDKESKGAKTQCKEEFGENLKKVRSSQYSRSCNRSIKMIHCESTPDIFLTRGESTHKKLRIGSALQLKKQTSRFA